jgi:DNA-binding NarL/FixJ family response regulator
MRVLIIDNHPQFRADLKAFINGISGLTVVGEADSGEKAVKMAELISPELILMDLKMDGMDGLQATRQIKSTNPEISIIVLTIYDEDIYRLRAENAGAAAFILKDEIPEKLIPEIARLDADS